jgi:hypothetical protein
MIIKIDEKQKPAFCEQTAKYLSSLLNTKITFSEVLDELFLYEIGSQPANEVLSHYIIERLKDVTVNA